MIIIEYFKSIIRKFKKNREFKKRLKKMKERDPFTYKNF